MPALTPGDYLKYTNDNGGVTYFTRSPSNFHDRYQWLSLRDRWLRICNRNCKHDELR